MRPDVATRSLQERWRSRIQQLGYVITTVQNAMRATGRKSDGVSGFEFISGFVDVDRHYPRDHENAFFAWVLACGSGHLMWFQLNPQQLKA